MSASRLLSAPAKVNLSLRVRGRNSAKGLHSALHKIESQIVFLDLQDRIEVLDRQDSGNLAVEFDETYLGQLGEESLPVCEDHSLSRAARALAESVRAQGITDGVKELKFALEFPWEFPWNVVVRKAIPAGAGLGGGSSDAASFLRYAREKLDARGVSLSDDEWLSVARAVGSDVALFFLRGESNCAFVSGFGERVLAQESLPICGVVLLCGAGLSTAEVYRRYDCEQDEKQGKKQGEGREDCEEEPCLSSSPSSRLAVFLEGSGNDLLSAACALDGSIVERLSALRSCEEVFCARMTGSGSACFGLTALGDEEGVATKLRARGLRGVIATRFLPRFLQNEEGDEAGDEEGARVDKARGEV